MLSGYARPRVERVRVVWDEGREEAPVELFRVNPDAELEIVSYGEGGDEIGPYEYRSDVTN